VKKFLLLILFLSFLTDLSLGQEIRRDLPHWRQGTTPLEALTGEDLNYDIDFLWFDHLAEARLTFKKLEEPDTYEAVLEARTLGVIAWITSDRTQRYVSRMKRMPDGSLRALFYESRIIKGKGKKRKDRTNAYFFDHEKNEVIHRRGKDGVFYKEEVIPMGSEAPNDVLTAFYNFRLERFGPIVPGASYAIPTYSLDGSPTIRVEVLTDEQRKDYPFFPEGGTLCRGLPSPEIFDTGGGWVYVWFDDTGRPARGIVENVIGLGDAKGTLRSSIPSSAESGSFPSLAEVPSKEE